MALSEAEQQRRRASIRDLFPATPFMGWLGVVVEEYEPDRAVLRVRFRENLTNDGEAYHGGVIASLIDSAGALAAWSNHDFDKGARAATVAMTVQYLGAARASDLVAEGRAVKRGRELIFTEIHVSDDEGQTLAHALQTYRIV